MTDLANNPTAIAIATSAALGAFAGASYAMLTGKDDEIERYAGRAGPSTAALGVSLGPSRHLARLLGAPALTMRSTR